jgi:hypothetical protein
MTLFPTSSCLSNKHEWLEPSAGIHVPGKYCLTFSYPPIIRHGMLQELLEIDGVSVYTIKPVTWLVELVGGESRVGILGNSLLYFEFRPIL